MPAHPVGQGPDRAAVIFHEIKHDGYRIIACKRGEGVRLWSRNGWDWSKEFLAVADALKALNTDDLVLDGEAMAHTQFDLAEDQECGLRAAMT